MVTANRAAIQIEEFLRLHGYGWDTKSGVVFTKVRWKDRTKGILQNRGDRLKCKDANCKIAANGRSRGMAFAKHNVRDFEDMGIDISTHGKAHERNDQATG